MRTDNQDHVLRVGTRRSLLAKAQTQWVVERIARSNPGLQIEVQEIVTSGDMVLDTAVALMPGKGVFVKEIEEKLLNEEIDLAVHSMKDLPTEMVPGLIIGATPERLDPRDVFIARQHRNLEDMPSGAKIGTGSLRRKAQLLHYRPDFQIVHIRGNIDTRLKKAETNVYDGIILAAAGLARLNWLDRIQQFLSCELMIPAVGQGALGIQMRESDEQTKRLIAPLNDRETEIAVKAERLFLGQMGGGCQTPIAAFCRVRDGNVVFQGFCADEEGHDFHKETLEGTVAEAMELASQLADRLMEKSKIVA